MSQLKSLGDELWKKTDKVNTELFVLLYGSLVSSLIKDSPNNMEHINNQLDKMGYQIGVRLVEDFLARSGIVTKCTTFQETIEVLRAAIKMFLGTYPAIINWSSDGRECIMSLEENPLVEWVNLSETMTSDSINHHGINEDNDDSEIGSIPLIYCQIYCGMIRGALEMVQVQVKCAICQDPLVEYDGERNKLATHFKLTLSRFLSDPAPLENDSSIDQY